MTTVAITPEMLARHNRPGPRYTSYPTVPVWDSQFGAHDYHAALAEVARNPHEPLALYVHLPFCAERCHYCGCNATSTNRAAVVDTYLDRLEQEVQMVTDVLGARRQTIQIHLGGGTPNFLTADQTRRLHTLLTTAFALTPRAELSVEIDPRIASVEQFQLYRELGFRRVSLGVQDFDPNVQRAIGRIQPAALTKASYNACRDLGFASINLDLVYGLPGQTPATFRRTLDEILQLAPDRVACFSYAHVPWVKPNQKQVDITFLPGPDVKIALLQMTIEAFTEAGYVWIGMDHFARPDDELAVALRQRRLHRNFMGYTTQPTPYNLAFGMSAISELGDYYAQNDSKLGQYQKDLDAGHLPIVRGYHLSPDDRLRRVAINHLMCNLELPYSLTEAEFGVRLDEALGPELRRLAPYIDEGWLVPAPDRLTVTPLGRFFLRNICMELDAYYEQPDHARPLFSQTV